MNHSKDNQEQTLEQRMGENYRSLSNETTSNDLDQSILAMANAHLEKGDSKSKGFWNRLFGSKKAKYAFSVATAMFMTVGIARFMVHLSKTDQGLTRNSEVFAAQDADTVSFEMANSEAYVKEQIARDRAQYSEQLAKREKRAVPNLVTNDEMEALLSTNRKETESQELAMLEDSENVIVTTGSRIKKVDTEEATQVAEIAKVSTVRARALKAESDANAGVLDEAVLGYPLPEVWLEEIQEHLNNDEISEALEQWQQFKQSYPEYKVPEMIKNQIQFAQKIAQ